LATVRRQNRARAGEDRCEDAERSGSDRSSTIREEHGRVSHPSPAPVRMEHPPFKGSGHRGEEPPGPTSPGLLQEAYGNIASLRFHHHSRSLQPRIGAGGAPDPFKQEAHGVAGNAAARPQLSSVTPRVQRFPAEETPAPGGPGPEVTGATTATPTGETTSAAPPPPGLIVEDSVPDLTPGQMRKGEFLSLLRAEVCRTAAEALAGTIWSAAGCPWIDHWFGYYGGRDSQSIERAIRRYAPESAGVTGAESTSPSLPPGCGAGSRHGPPPGRSRGCRKGHRPPCLLQAPAVFFRESSVRAPG